MKPSMPRPKPSVDIVVAEPRWRKARAGLLADLRDATHAALARQRGTLKNEEHPQVPQSLTILLADDAALENLNTRFRGKNRPTNVLSFPAAGPDAGYLGDIAIAYGVTAREAAEAGKTLPDHAIHLTVHGVLHLLGYNHETAREARIMEPLEITILAELGIANPYLVRPVLAATAD